MEELENAEIKRKMINEQKKLRERAEKQKKKSGLDKKEKVTKPEETKDERLARMAKEKAANPKPKMQRGANNFGGEGVVDTAHVQRLVDERKQCLPNLLLNVDLEVILKHDLD